MEGAIDRPNEIQPFIQILILVYIFPLYSQRNRSGISVAIPSSASVEPAGFRKDTEGIDIAGLVSKVIGLPKIASHS